MMKQKDLLTLIEATPKSKKWIKKIYQFQQNHYKKEKRFIPNLKLDMVGGFGKKGILDFRNLFHQKADVIYFIALKGKKMVGTISAVLHHSHIKQHQEKAGFFGMFEVINDYSVAQALLDKASEWLKSRGMERIRGPYNLDINGGAGLLIHGFETKPFFETVYNFSYYQDFLEQYGFKKDKDLYAQLLPVHLEKVEEEKRQARINKVSEYVQKNNTDLRIEKFNTKDYREHLQAMQYIFNQAWSDNWGFIPITNEEFQSLAESLRLIADRDMTLLAYHRDKPIAFIVCIPDLYEVTGKFRWLPEVLQLGIALVKIKLKRMKRHRVIMFGLLPEYRKLGVDAWLFGECFKASQKAKYQESELSWLLEDNDMVLKAGEKLGASHYKTWRVFGKSL